MKPRHFTADGDQRGKKTLFGQLRAHGVHQQAHFDTGARAQDQGIQQGTTGTIWVVDVVLKVDVVTGLRDGIQKCRVFVATIHQQAHVTSGAGGQPGGGVRQCAQFHTFIAATLRAEREVDMMAASTCTMAYDALRAQHVIDGKADVGQRRQTDQPAQGSGRLAFLQDDLAA